MILKESCSCCNYPEKIQCKQAYVAVQAIDKLQKHSFWTFEAGARAADVPHSFGCNEQLIYRLQTCFRQSGSKNDNPPSGRPQITTPLEGRVIVTST